MDFMFANFGVLKLQNQTSLMFSNPHTNTDPLQIWRVTAILGKKKKRGGISSILSVAAILEDPTTSIMKTVFTLQNTSSYTESFALIDH